MPETYRMAENQPTPSPKKSSSSIAWFVIALIVVMFGLLTLARNAMSPGTGVGEKLPSLDLVPLTGQSEPVALADLRGKVVLVNFFATWCGPCQIEMPHLAALGERLAKEKDFVLLPIACDDLDLPSLRGSTREMLARLELDLPTYADPDQTTRDAFASVGRLEGFPTSFVVDREGVIQKVWVGYGPSMPDQMQATVEQLLNE